ncbi:MAG: archaeosortase/exosortase family protein, partial [Opitutia bacterium]
MDSAEKSGGIDRQTVGFGLILGAMAAFATWDQWAVWSTKEDYTFGYLVPALAAYVLWDRWEPLRAELTGAGDGGPPAPGWAVTTAYLLAFVSL